VSWLRRVLDKRSELFGDDNCISDRLHFSSWVDVDWDSIFEKEILKEIIHDYLFRDGVVGYFFPSFIKAIDKSGDNISKVLSELIQKFNVSNDDEKFKLQRLARVAGEYRRNSNGWMIISAAICEKLSGEDIELQKEFFLSLDWNGIGSISGVRGTVPVYYTDQLKELEGLYIDDQKKGVLVREEYWKQEIEWARNELKQAEEKAREERGE
jgi:hypothetical protein